MSKEESPAPAGGLLSKVVRFVRNPGVHWTELDSSPESQESQYSKQMLKEMIERKRHNDMVRKREFDQLRQIRRREMLQGHRSQDPTGRPSFFQSSMASPDERAVTLKKIDEIEAQMSQQWWKSKQGGVDASSPRAAAAAVPAPAPVSPHAFAPTAPAQVQQEQDDSLPSVVPLFPDNSMEVEGFGTTDANLTGVVPQAAEVPFPELPPLPTLAPEPIAEPEEFVHEPELEEAAIRFANADYAGAEVGLRDVLAQYQQPGAPDTPAALEIWMTLFDFYRATGAQDKFEPLAIEFAARYSRSAPIWFSMPEQLGLVEIPEEDAAIAARKFNWNGPPTLAVSSVAALHALLQRSASPWTLSWARIIGIDDAAVPLLADQFTQWADRTGEFAFSGVDKLHALMESKTQAGDRSTGPEWWRLRMAAMRLMGRPDDFEMVALDYCVTYEVSPPSWVPPRCTYTDDSTRAVTPSAPSSRDWMNSDLHGLSVPMALESIPQIKLSGHIDGDATALLEPFEPHLRQGAPTVIACDQLIRMDFAAAGSVLNWAAEQQAKGYVLHFTNLQRLVAVLLNVIGVNEHAFIVPRKN